MKSFELNRHKITFFSLIEEKEIDFIEKKNILPRQTIKNDNITEILIKILVYFLLIKIIIRIKFCKNLLHIYVPAATFLLRWHKISCIYVIKSYIFSVKIFEIFSENHHSEIFFYNILKFQRERNRTCNFVWFFVLVTCFHFQKRCPIQDVRTFLSVHWISAAHVTEEIFVEKSYYMCEVLRKKKGIGSRSHWGSWV